MSTLPQRQHHAATRGPAMKAAEPRRFGMTRQQFRDFFAGLSEAQRRQIERIAGEGRADG